MLVTFPCDDAHSAFITTVIEGVGVGSDFGSVVVLPVDGGMAAYRHQVLPLHSPAHRPVPVPALSLSVPLFSLPTAGCIAMSHAS